MADTITLLNGLLFQKLASSDVWTLDGDGLEAVKSYLVAIPPGISGARVIFNGAWDPDGGRYHGRVMATMLTGLGTLTKTQNTLALEWTAITPPAVIKSAEINTAPAYACELHIDVAMSSTTANTTGIEIRVQVRKKVTVDEWTDLPGGTFIGPTGTAVKSDCSGTTNAGETVVGVTNPATGALNHLGKNIFFEDTVDITHCEIGFLVAQSGD
jgi:hypothetical protein